jgi:shikimate O-hydroxycinnamoyltransferase
MRKGKKSTWVRTGSTIPLTGYDLVMGYFCLRLLFSYKETLNPERLRTSLIETLRDFPIFSGRMITDEKGKVVISCNDAGAKFNVVESNNPFFPYTPEMTAKTEVKQFTDFLFPFEIVDFHNPLLSVRLTQMSGGGSVLGISMPHSVVDAFSFFDFLYAWSRCARGESHPKPLLEREHLDAMGRGPSGKESCEETENRLIKPVEVPAIAAKFLWQSAQTTTRVFRFEPDEMKNMKEIAAKDLKVTDRWVSTQDLLSAHIWREVAASQRPRGRAQLDMIYDIRGLDGLGLSERYIGNAVTYRSIKESFENLRKSSLLSTAQKIREKRDTVTAENVKQDLAYYASHKARGTSKWLAPGLMIHGMQNGVLINNYCRFPVYDIDFGQGAPDWFEPPPNPIRRMAFMIPTPARDSGCDVHLILPKWEMRRFLERKEKLHLYQVEAS